MAIVPTVPIEKVLEITL